MKNMKATQRLHDLGQSLWFDNAFAADGGEGEKAIGRFRKAGIDIDALAAQLQEEGAAAFVKSWNHLLAVIEAKSGALAPTAQTDGSAS